MKLEGHVERMGKRVMHIHSILTRNPEGKGPLVKHKHKWDDAIKAFLRKIRWGIMDRMNVAQEGNKKWDIVNTEMKLGFP
jgi:hypothetical protein